MSAQTNNKTIAKNTLFLYFRMMITMVISLFTSRVILQALGVNDYGIYHVVGGLVGLLSFVNNALATGSSRFLTYELGTGDFKKLEKTFSTVLSVHILLCIAIVLVAETIGLWFVYNKLIIAPERMDAAVYAYHLSVLAAVFTITQVPYRASIISHEKMSIYAYTSIVEVVLKLVIVYMIYVSPYDKLETYATLFFIVHVSMTIYYRLYCIKNFKETHYKPVIDKPIIKEVLGYSGWNLFANTAIALNNQGATILINMFFSPGVVAARAIANQVNMSAFHFITNFRTASNPQIVKRYAAGDYEASKELLLNSTKFSYYLMLILALPITLVAEPLLHLWLGIVPEYAVAFLQLTVITSLFQVFDSSFYTALYAKGRIRENAMISPTILFLTFPIVYVFFRLGYSPLVLAWILLIAYAMLGLVVKPLLIIKIVGYTWKDVLSVFVPCLKITMLAVPIPLMTYFFVNSNILESKLLAFFIIVLVSIISVSIVIWICGINQQLRKKIISLVAKKIKYGVI